MGESDSFKSYTISGALFSIVSVIECSREASAQIRRPLEKILENSPSAQKTYNTLKVYLQNYLPYLPALLV
ncbi:hypothetical protein FJZ18_00495 [Candidatus Pacearchaeota archaeon]|nr:hypothetical protein [Candidatus Pacearchaeota archaeon]